MPGRYRQHHSEESKAAIAKKKQSTELKDKPYYPLLCATLMMYDYGFVRQIVYRRNEAQPRYSNREIRDIMRHPMSFFEIIRSRRQVMKNLYYGFFGMLPPIVSVAFLKFFLVLTNILVYFRRIKKRKLRMKSVVTSTQN